jgi:hypothetical protein
LHEIFKNLLLLKNITKKNQNVANHFPGWRLALLIALQFEDFGVDHSLEDEFDQRFVPHDD